jgi:light-regulated signal transduction histidine kinase (bacteriophytochrome)
MSVLLGNWRDQRVSNAELARSNRELEQFAYVASHDLKAPLVVVAGFLELLRSTKGDQLDEDGRMYVDAALRGAARMDQLIDDLLAFSRVGRVDHQSDWADLAAVVAQLLVDWESAVSEAGAVVHVGTLPSVLGDATLLRQLFENLFSNAVKFRRPSVDAVIEITSERRHCEWLVSVSDNGIGVPYEHRDSIFTMFSRLTQSADLPGCGIGLAICQRVVQAHGGRLWVEDGIAGGAKVCFTLPA